MLLGAVVPELRSRAEKLTGDLTELVSLRKPSHERDRLALTATSSGRPDRLAALVDERQRQQSSIEKRHGNGRRARHHAVPAGRQPPGLIAKMEQNLKSAAKAAETGQSAGRARALNGKPNLGR